MEKSLTSKTSERIATFGTTKTSTGRRVGIESDAALYNGAGGYWCVTHAGSERRKTLAGAVRFMKGKGYDAFGGRLAVVELPSADAAADFEDWLYFRRGIVSASEIERVGVVVIVAPHAPGAPALDEVDGAELARLGGQVKS